MSAKLTPWFPGDVKPVRRGVYLRIVLSIGERYAFCDGYAWHAGRITAELAAREQGISMWQSAFHWRGLASDPEAA